MKKTKKPTTPKKQDHLSTPVDQYGRYKAVYSVITELAAKKRQKHLKILDIGGFKGLTTDFFSKEASVTIVDLYDDDSPNYVKGSALELPFADDSFDYVVSFEVLEHIPREHRGTYVREALRVSKGPFILTAPFAGPNGEVAQAEVLVNDMWRSIYPTDHPWLSEHIEFKIPSEAELEAIINDVGVPFAKVGNNDVTLWSLMLSFTYLTTLFRPSGANPEIERFYNENQQALESNTAVPYRYMYVIGADASQPLRALQPPQASMQERISKQNELVSRVFSTLAKDMQTALQAKDTELRKLSRKLERRIQDHDKLVEELGATAAQLHALQNSRAVRASAKIKKLIGK